jgi:hypothetical protein
MGGVIEHAKLDTDHLGHALPGPHLAAEAIGLGATVQQVRQTGQLVGSQPAGGARRWLMAQRLWAAQAGSLHPLADRSGADPQGRGNLALRPALLFEVPGLQAACFFPIVWDWVHTEQRSTRSLPR